MALKTITFTVEADQTLSPATVQEGGVQGDHKATEVAFKFSNSISNYLQVRGTEGKLVYRFDAYDGQGEVHSSDTADLAGNTVKYPLAYNVTHYGGLVKVELIISLINGENTSEVIHTESARLKLSFNSFSTRDKSQGYTDMSTLAEITKQNAAKAELAASEATTAKKETESAAAAFTNDTTFIFDGGNASSEVDASFIVDTSMSKTSTNAVQNKAITKYVDSKCPVGTVWIGGKNGSKPIDPSTIFGGEWELIDKEFASIIIKDEDGTGGLFAKEEIVSGYELLALCSGHTIRLRLVFTPDMVFEDNYGGNEFSKAVGQLELEKLGITTFYYSLVDIVAMSDNSNGLLMAIINNDGLVSISDVIKSNTANQKVIISTEITCRGADMLDSFCDKFYWVKKSDLAKE